MKSRLIIFITITLFLLTAVACQKNPTQEEMNEVTTGTKEVTVRLRSIVNVLDIYRAFDNECFAYFDLVYDSILEVDRETDLTLPNSSVISKSYLENPVTMVLEVRDNVDFSNGSKLTPEDIIYSIELAIEGGLYFPYPALALITDMDVEGNNVRVTLSEPHPEIIPSMGYILVYNKDKVEEMGLEVYNRNPITTGPYKILDFVPGERVTIEARNDYWNGVPDIKNYEFISIGENVAAYMALESGDINLTEISHLDVERAQEHPDINVSEFETTQLFSLLFNTSKAPFNDINLRLAFSYAFNKEGYAVLNESFIPHNHHHPKMTDYYYVLEDGTGYDPEGAKSLFTQLGISPETPRDIEMLTFAGDPMIKVLEAYQLDLKNYGVNLNLTTIEFVALNDVRRAGEFEMLSFPSAFQNSPFAYLTQFSSEEVRGTPNSAFYNNERINEIATSAFTNDYKTNVELAMEVHQILNAEMPMLPCYIQKAYFAYDKNLENIEFYRTIVPYLRKSTLQL